MDRRCNTLDDLSDKARVPNIAKGINWKVFDMMKGTHKARTSIKHIPCDCRWKFYGEKWNKEEYQCQCKRPAKHHAFEKDYAQNLSIWAQKCNENCRVDKNFKNCNLRQNSCYTLVDSTFQAQP